MIETYTDVDGQPPTNGYSHAAAGTGRLVVVSGQLPLDGRGQLVSTSDVFRQAQQVFQNIERVLAAAGAAADDVLRLGLYLTDLADLPAVRQARDEFLRDVPAPPASTLVQVVALVVPHARVEVDALAVTSRPVSD